MRGRGHLETVLIGTVLVHIGLLTLLDIGGTWAVRHPDQPPPEAIEIDNEPPPPPEVKLPELKFPTLPTPPEKTAPPPEKQRVAVREPSHPQPAHEPTREPPPPDQPPPDPSAPPGGGDEPYKLPEGPTGGVAVPVGHGHGTGGTGRGTGGGSGSAQGSGSGTPAAVSIAAIKVKAKPRGDYSFFDAGKDYPPEAKQLQIEGTIRVRLLVDASGKVRSKTLLNKLGHGLDELALARAAQIEFEPAKDDRDQPVASLVIWTFDFRLPQ
jgi:protein TonB